MILISNACANIARELLQRSRFALVVLALLVLPVAQVFAADITVRTGCTLNQAVNAATRNQTYGSCPAGDDQDDTIILTADITLSATQTIATDVTIDGKGFTISGGSAVQVFSIGNSVDVTIKNLTITDGSARSGGGIANQGTLTINNSTISGNTATAGGGGIYNNTGTLTINNSTISGNTASTSGGGIYSTGTLTINNSTIQDNTASDYGGGIYSTGTLTIENNSTIRDNKTTSDSGGGIYNSGTLTINNSTIRNNDSKRIAGGILVWSNANATITNSSIVHNTSLENGGGIAALANSTVTVRNSTIADNRIDVEDSAGSALTDGGGVLALGTFTLEHVTLVKNTAPSSYTGGISFGVSASTGHIRNSILSGNSNRDCNGRAFTTNVGNLIQNPGNCGAGDLNADPMLGSLTGSPPYYPLLIGSPAVDAADQTTCDALSPKVDQRGVARPVGTACDIGAFEGAVEPPPPPVEGEEECVGCPPPKGPFVRTTIALLPEIEVSDLTGFTEAQRIDAEGVGIQSVIDRGIVDAVDVWGFMGAGTRVCFLASGGSFSFLNAATAPRTVSSLPLYVIEGKTCTFIDGPGSVVLHPGAASASNGPAWGLSNCMVTTTAVLNFRDGPGGEVIGGVPYNATLTALSRTAGWFEVDYHGATGWISAQYVTPNGDCG